MDLVSASRLTEDGVSLSPVVTPFVRHWGEADLGQLAEAFFFAAEAHRGQRRRSGDPFLSHPVAVAATLASSGADTETVQAGLLHDVVEDTDVPLAEIAGRFGETVAHLVDGVTKIDSLHFTTRFESQAATVQKMIVAMTADPRVLVVKLADRLHNMETMAPMPAETKVRKAKETLEVYAPLAARLGIEDWKHRLQELAFPLAHPEEWVAVDAQIRSRHRSRTDDMEAITARLTEAFSAAGIEGELVGRKKHHYSVWRKMVTQGRPFSDVYDLIGLRLIVESVAECYLALGAAHGAFMPVPDRFVDHIAIPKPNGYQSLHTTLIGPGGAPFELQIRTRQMDAQATYGAAAHWAYKEGVAAPPRSSWRARSSYEEAAAAAAVEYYADLVADLGHGEEIFVLTPCGEPVALPVGATPVDFAYRVHTEVGHACRGAKVNGRLVPLSTVLRSGDQVEILTSSRPDPLPSRRWLDFVVSSGARQKIRRHLEAADASELVSAGRRLLSDAGVSPFSDDLAVVASQLGFADSDGLLVAVGARRVSASTVRRRLEGPEVPAPRSPASTGPQPAPAVVVDGWPGVETFFPACCAPEPPAHIIGYVTVGRGVSVHDAACVNVSALDPNRRVPVWWAGYSRSPVGWLVVAADDRPGMLASVTAAISALGANIVASEGRRAGGGSASLRFCVEVSDPDHLEDLAAELESLDGVLSSVTEAA